MITKIIIGIVGTLGLGFIISKLKNKSALRDMEAAKEEILNLLLKKERNEGKLEMEEDERNRIKAELEAELNREVTNEELVDFINDRYSNNK